MVASSGAALNQLRVVIEIGLTGSGYLRTDTEPTQRDRHLQCIAEKGRIGWQKMSGYNKRSRVEAAIGRYKQVIGDGLRFRKDERRATEITVAVHVMNRMLEFGRPLSIRIA
jgi:hypothetical protein